LITSVQKDVKKPSVNAIKLFSLSHSMLLNKLECLSMQDFPADICE
jgi:hypothetical protein